MKYLILLILIPVVSWSQAGDTSAYTVKQTDSSVADTRAALSTGNLIRAHYLDLSNALMVGAYDSIFAFSTRFTTKVDTGRFADSKTRASTWRLRSPIHGSITMI